jgi:hypothetical protein
VTGPPSKSIAGVRAVALPAIIVVVMKAHLVEFPAERNELVFGAAGCARADSDAPLA